MMTEDQATLAVYSCAQSIKNALGKEKAIGLFMGCIIGEVMLSGGTKQDLDNLTGKFWVQFEEAQRAAKGG